MTEPALRPIRSILPNLGGIDISPVILILILMFISNVVLLGWILPAVVNPPSTFFERGRVRLALRRVAAGIMLPVRLTPKSSRDEIVGIEAFGGETVLKARVRALPEDGRANEALAKLIAHWLKLPPSFRVGGARRQVADEASAGRGRRGDARASDRGAPRRASRLAPRRSRATMASAAARGSAARVIGRPTTR